MTQNIDIDQLLQILNSHTTNQHVRMIQRALGQKYPNEIAFTSGNLHGDTKWDRLDHILQVLETYGDIQAAYNALVQIKPDDRALRLKLQDMHWTPIRYGKEVDQEQRFESPPGTRAKLAELTSIPGGEISVGPDDSLWNAVIGGILYHIDDGVHRDIINGLQTARLDALFSGITNHRQKLWGVLSRPQDDTAYSYAADLWMELWTQEGGLPPFNMVRLLAQKEYSGDLYKGYRDHVVHSLLVYLLGLHIYYSNRRIQEAMAQIGEPSEFLKAWKVAALFHDMGYYLNIKDAKSTAESQRLLLEQLQKFASNPLQAYGAAHKAFSLAGSDETEIRRQAGSCPVWELNALTDLRKPFPPAKGHILDGLDDLVRGANLADHRRRRYCYRYDKYAQDTDTDTYSRCDDHGMVSAMILLGQHTHFQRYTDATCKPGVLDRVMGLSSEAYEQMLKLPERTRKHTNNIRQAAAAIALHNVHVTGWAEHDPNWSKSRSEPYYLTLDQYRLSLNDTPLPWLLALTDVLQCWDRPKRTEAPLELKDCTIKHQEIRITATPPDKIAVAFVTDDFRNTPGSRFRKLIDELNQYMDNLDLLEEETS